MSHGICGFHSTSLQYYISMLLYFATPVVYAKDQQLLQQEVNGQKTVIADLHQAYISVNDLPKVLMCKINQEAAVS